MNDHLIFQIRNNSEKQNYWTRATLLVRLVDVVDELEHADLEAEEYLESAVQQVQQLEKIS